MVAIPTASSTICSPDSWRASDVSAEVTLHLLDAGGHIALRRSRLPVRPARNREHTRPRRVATRILLYPMTRRATARGAGACRNRARWFRRQDEPPGMHRGLRESPFCRRPGALRQFARSLEPAHDRCSTSARRAGLPGREHERPRERDPLRLARRELPRRPPTEAFETDFSKSRTHGALHRLTANPETQRNIGLDRATKEVGRPIDQCDSPALGGSGPSTGLPRTGSSRRSVAPERRERAGSSSSPLRSGPRAPRLCRGPPQAMESRERPSRHAERRRPREPRPPRSRSGLGGDSTDHDVDPERDR